MTKTGQTGNALLTVLIVMLVLALLISGMLLFVGTGTVESLEMNAGSGATSAAETGISLGRAYVTTNLSWASAIPVTITGGVGNAGFVVNITTAAPDTALVVSTGTLWEARHTSIWKQPVPARILGMVVYRQASNPNLTNPRYRWWPNSARIGTEETAQSVNADPTWIRCSPHPVSNRHVVAAQNANGEVWVQVWTNTALSTVTQLNLSGSVPSATARGFDVAHEQLSGRALAVYANGTTQPRYRLWNGSAWNAENPVNMGAGGAIQWIRLVPQPASDRVLLLARWRAGTRNYSAATFWTGTAWTGLTNLEFNCASAIAADTIDGACSTGGAVVVYINGTTVAARQMPNYRTWNPSTGWSAEGTMPSLGSDLRWVRVEYNPAGTIAFADILTSGRTLWGTYWTGASWTAPANFPGAVLETATQRPFDIAWSSQTNMLMAVYGLANANAHSYMAHTMGQAPVFGTLPATDDARWSLLKTDPASSNMLYVAIDDQNDVNLHLWNGTTWSLVGELEPLSDTSYNSLGISFTGGM